MLSLTRSLDCPSGRSIVLRVLGTNEEVEILSANGQSELRLVLTEQGPVLRLSGVRLELEATQTVAVRCRHFQVQAEETMTMSGQQMQVRTTGDIALDGDHIRLNCERKET